MTARRARRNLTPLQGRILGFLEEAGEETLGCVMNTECVAVGESGSPDWMFGEAIAVLVRQGLVRWSGGLKAF